MTISGHTKLAAVVGSPVRHSFSPALHNAAFESLGLDWTYVALEVAEDDGASVVPAMRALGIAGLSVTMPHKAAVASSADVCSPAAERLGAANCLSWQDGRVRADNTDVAGFIDALRIDAGFDPAGATVAVLGAGGAARAGIVGLAEAGVARVSIVNRSVERAEAAAALAPEVAVVAPIEAVADAQLIVNATSVGMAASPGSPIDGSVLGAGQVVLDMIYAPTETELMRSAAAAGASAHNGLAMLLHQAAHAFTIWTGEQAPLDAMRSVLGERFG